MIIKYQYYPIFTKMVPFSDGNPSKTLRAIERELVEAGFCNTKNVEDQMNSGFVYTADMLLLLE